MRNHKNHVLTDINRKMPFQKKNRITYDVYKCNLQLAHLVNSKKC